MGEDGQSQWVYLIVIALGDEFLIETLPIPRGEALTFINQEVQIDPPLKRLWGPISVGLVILILGGFALFAPVTEQENRAIPNELALTAEPQPAFNKEVRPEQDTPFARPKHFNLMVVENLVGTLKTDSNQNVSLVSLAIDEEHPSFDPTTTTATLLQATQLVGESLDGQTRLEGYVSVQISGPYLIVSLTMDVSPTQPDISYTTDEVYYEERPSTD